MRNNHRFKTIVPCRCPFEECGKTFDKAITVEYVTNQRGDVIEHTVFPFHFD